MELKSVEIVGFKSFADRLILTFHGGITAIVGPNGSGKSNVSDAIRWVLGEQSAKSLRGARMEDVIFAGTQRRRPVNFAQVTLTLDNRDRSLGYDYDEVAISRKMYRSGESEYLLNGVRCRLKDVQELLMDTGIGKDGYSIIGQGRIDQLLSNKPQDRRMIFEEAAGIVKFKTRREEANRQLAEEQANLQRVSDILEEASSRLAPLEKQAKEARRYLALTQELKGLEVQGFLRQYGQLTQQQESVGGKLEELKSQLEETRQNQQEVKRASLQAAVEADEAARKVVQAVQELNDLRLRRESQDGERRLGLQRMEQLRKDKRNAAERLEEAKARLTRRSTTCEKERQQLGELYKKLEAQQAQQALLLETDRQSQEEYESSLARLEKLNQSQETLRAELEELKEAAARQEVRQEQDQDQHGDLQQRVEALEAEWKQKQEEAALRQEALETAHQQFDDCSRQVVELTDEISGVRERLRQAQEKQQEAQQAAQQLQSRMKWLQELEREYEGYAGSVKVIMQRRAVNPQQYGGILGTVADLIQVPARFSTAIEIALGAAVQNIVTDTQQTAKEWIEYLRQKKAGRATFLPLDHISAREVRKDPQLIQMPGIIGYANELIRYEKRYQNIFSRLLGNVVVAQDFDSAAAAAQRYGQYLRIVTLKGDIFNIGGSITGGSTGGKTATILNRKGELDMLSEELENARKNGRSCMETVALLSEERRKKAVLMEELSRKREAFSQETAQKQSEYDQAELLLQMVQTQLEEARKNNEVLARSLQDNQSSLEKIHQELQEKQGAYESCMEDARRQKDEEQELRRKREEMRSQTMRIRIELSTSQQLITSMEHSVEREESDMRQDRQEIDQYERQLQENTQELSHLESETMRSEAELDEVGRQIREFSEKIEELTRERDEKEEKRRASVTVSEEAIHMVSDLEKEQYRLESQMGRAKKERDELQDRIWEKYEITYNAALRLELPQPESQAAANRRVSELKEQIKELGSVNVHAVDEYETLQERCHFLGSQLEDVRKAEASLQEIIRQLTEQMEKQFQEGFGKISEQFNQVFRTMFGGGKGMLRLEEEDNPLESGIEIIAQPPGKTLKSMTALSGGERALTAIAILFAIQQLKPAPFCILDEIEAALDDANVNRYADFLKTLCGTTQFIVITHRKGTMEAASTMYGITMEEKGVSKCISVKFE